MYIERNINKAFIAAMSCFPCVLLCGPRQSGKTTFLNNEITTAASSENYKYISFDDPLARDFASQDPKGFLEQFSKSPAVLDEIQYVPDLLQYIKINIDQNRTRNGWWIMTGSQQFQMMQHISESLAGRVAIFEMLPFSYSEQEKYSERTVQDLLWFGGYPANVLNSESRDIWLSSYISTYLERDVRNIQYVKDLSTFQSFIGICAANHSQELNIASISRDCGINQQMCKEWIGILNSSFITFRLNQFHNNLGKRLIKSPKLYFWDPALVAFLTRQTSADSLFNGAMSGAFFEGLIVSETMKLFSSKGLRPNMFFWRSHDGLEVDLILEIKGKIYPIEIKKTSSPNSNHAKNLNAFTNIAKSLDCSSGLIVCCIEGSQPLPFQVIAMGWKEYLSWLNAELGLGAPG